MPERPEIRRPKVRFEPLVPENGYPPLAPLAVWTGADFKLFRLPPQFLKTVSRTEYGIMDDPLE